jgi:hypothetical protein
MPAGVRTILLLVGSLDIPTPNFIETATYFTVWVTSQGQMGRPFARQAGIRRDGGTQRHPPGTGTGIGRGSGVPIDDDVGRANDAWAWADPSTCQTVQL